MKTVASIRICQQVSPDDWEMVAYHKQLTEHTTIGQLLDWVDKKLPSHERGKYIPKITIELLEE